MLAKVWKKQQMIHTVGQLGELRPFSSAGSEDRRQ